MAGTNRLREIRVIGRVDTVSCYRCKKWLPVKDFTVSYKSPCGCVSTCKHCINEVARERRSIKRAAQGLKFRQRKCLQVVDNVEMLECSKCNTLKPVDRFYKSHRNLVGYTSWCKLCYRKT